MSRIRIVEGKITKNTGVNHYMYSKGNIVFNAGGFINETAKHYSYGDPLPAPEVQKTKKILDMYWTYGDTKLNDKSRFYVDMNLIIKTKNYKEGETIKVVIKSDDGEALTNDIHELNLTGTIGKDGMVIFEQILKDYTLNLLVKDDSVLNEQEIQTNN